MERNFSIECEFNGMEIPSFHIKEVELDACYMALNNLRNLLFQEPMLELLQYQIEEGTSYFESLIAESNDEYTESRIQLTVYGLSAREFRSMSGHWYESQPLDWMALRYVFPTHPGNYSVMRETDEDSEYGHLGRVQMIGRHIAKIWFADPTSSLDAIPEWLAELRDFEYKMVEYSTVKLDSGSVFFYLMNEFKETKDGCEIRLRAFSPSAAPASLIGQHTQHRAIEFRNLLYMVHAVVEAEKDSY
ncbi:hypothetical protein N7522_013884 [Penicillium canescens]|nr:hypothetical protein N7522_013884 [Penicillium canescens]